MATKDKDKAKIEETDAPPPTGTTAVKSPVAQLDEADALKLEKFALQLENLQLTANQVVAQRDSFNGFLIQKYSIDPAHDQIDLPSRAIQRGVK
jgi:hypothetical protein